MSPRTVGPCVVCGSTTRIERNHVAARANDPKLTVSLCKRCHDVFTDGQYALSILRREPLEARRSHSAGEQLWALCQGFALLALMGGPTEHAAPWVVLARAAGTATRIREEDAGSVGRWGPRPALGRRSRSLALRNGMGDPRPILEALVSAMARWLADDPAGPTFRANVLALTRISQPSLAVPAAWHPAVEMLMSTLQALVVARGTADLDAVSGLEEATLAAIREAVAVAPAAGDAK